MIILSTIIRGFFMFLMRQTIIVMSRYVEFEQKKEIFKKYTELDSHFYKANKIGDLMNRITEDVSRVRMYVGPSIMYIINLVIIMLFCLYSMFYTDWKLTLLVLIPLPFLSIIMQRINKKIHQNSFKLQGELSNLTSICQETFQGIRTIKNFGYEQKCFENFKSTNQTFKNISLQNAKVESLYSPVVQVLVSMSILIAVLVGATNAVTNPEKISLIIEFIFYLNLLSFPFNAIGYTAAMIQRAAASQERINEFLNTKSHIVNVPVPTKIDFGQSIHIALNEVNFSYTNSVESILKNINWQVNPSEKWLILGKIGAGKTTLVQLLLRFYNINSGTLNYNGTHIEQLDFTTLRKHIGYVPQETLLFSNTIINNIGIGSSLKPSQQNVDWACKLACIYDDIQNFPQKYETQIGERGIMLSGGQKQRIALARALIRKPPILILDDCLSAIDVETEQQILAHLNQLEFKPIIIMIAHKIFSKFKFDGVVILQEGTILEQGDPEELIKHKSYYYKMLLHQLEKEKLHL